MKFVDRTDTDSMAASFNGAAIHLETLEGFSINAVWTESSAPMVGTLTIQGSNNAFLDNTSNEEDSNAHWDDIPGFLAIVSGSGSFFWNIGDCFFKAARISYVRTSGDGSMTSYIYAKGWD